MSEHPSLIPFFFLEKADQVEFVLHAEIEDLLVAPHSDDFDVEGGPGLGCPRRALPCQSGKEEDFRYPYGWLGGSMWL